MQCGQTLHSCVRQARLHLRARRDEYVCFVTYHEHKFHGRNSGLFRCMH